jgi:opacity protein-like surface antigen
VRSVLLSALVLGASVARADNGLFYFGAGVARSNVDQFELGGANFPSINSTSWDVFAGVRPISPFAVEADYIDLGSQKQTIVPIFLGCGMGGSPCYSYSQSDAKALAGYAVGFLPIPVPYLDVYGKAGLARYKLNGSFCVCGGAPAQNFFTAASDNSTVFAWGAGVQAHIGIIGGRLEYEGFNKASTSVFSLSVFLNL